MPGSVNLHRVLSTSPEKVYRAFLDPEALVKWLPPHGFTAKIHSMEPSVGGGYRMSFTNFTTGKSHSFTVKYVALTPYKQIKYIDIFDDPSLPGEMQVTVTLQQVICGTDLKIVQQGIPDAIPVEVCYMGWQQSLALLTQLVEPEIKD